MDIWTITTTTSPVCKKEYLDPAICGGYWKTSCCLQEQTNRRRKRSNDLIKLFDVRRDGGQFWMELS